MCKREEISNSMFYAQSKRGETVLDVKTGHCHNNYVHLRTSNSSQRINTGNNSVRQTSRITRDVETET